MYHMHITAHVTCISCFENNSVPGGMFNGCCCCVCLFFCTDLQIESSMIKGNTLEGFRHLLLLVLLQDAAPLAAGPLLPSQLLSLEELLLKVPSSQADMLLSTVPNLLRMINSAAGMIQGGYRWLAMHRMCH